MLGNKLLLKEFIKKNLEILPKLMNKVSNNNLHLRIRIGKIEEDQLTLLVLHQLVIKGYLMMSLRLLI